MNQATLTIGIPTYYGGPSLIETVKSIRSNTAYNQSRVIVCVDGVPLKKPIEKALQKLEVDIVFSAVRGGQVARIKQIIALCKTPLLVLTQDDVLLDPNALERIVSAFEHDAKVTMVAACELPTKPTKVLENILEAGQESARLIAESWNKGNNYLTASGRCLAFRSDFVKQFFLPEEIINSDSYLYFENKRQHGKSVYVKNARVYNPLPQKLAEYINQSRKFAISQAENQRYFKRNLASEYAIPFSLKAQSTLLGFARKPLHMTAYIALNLYARFAGRNLFKNAVRFWETDSSTKRTKTASV